VRSGALTDNVETALLGFIGSTYCSLLASFPPRLLASSLVVFPLRLKR